MIVSGYTLDLYCDNADGHSPHDSGPTAQYTADGKKCYVEVRDDAVADGWIFKTNGTVICPKCSLDKLV